MSYILFYKDQVYGCYGPIELLRANILILLFRMLEKSQINSTKYENIVEYLVVPGFTISQFDIPEVKRELRDLNFRVEKIVHEGSSGCALEHILEHIEYRFEELEKILEKDVRICATFPGENPRSHQLGTMYYDLWKLFDPVNCDKVTKAMHDFIAREIEKLIEKYDDRIKFGDVLYQNASPINYQIWSANAVNWNRMPGMDIPGCYQAQEMKYQEKGVFGIVVTPRYGYKNLVPKDITKF